MGRMIAQLVCHSVFPDVLAADEASHLEGLFSFLSDNADMVRREQHMGG